MKMQDVTASMIVDYFIGDCLLADNFVKYQAAEIYKVYEAYCEQTGIGVPGGVRFFGGCMRKRFRRTMRQGRVYYYCEYKPGLFDVTT